MILSQTILLTHYFFYNYQEFQRHQQNIVVFIGWLASVNTVTLSKLGILYGVVVLGKGVYDIVQIYARKVAQSIGETILEPFNN